MNNYAIIEVNGTQEKVAVGDVVRVLGEINEETYTFDKVLALGGEKHTFGAPYIPKVVVKGVVTTKGLGKKIRVAKFKAKSKYHNVQGFRTQFTEVRITEIA